MIADEEFAKGIQAKRALNKKKEGEFNVLKGSYIKASEDPAMQDLIKFAKARSAIWTEIARSGKRRVSTGKDENGNPTYTEEILTEPERIGQLERSNGVMDIIARFETLSKPFDSADQPIVVKKPSSRKKQ